MADPSSSTPLLGLEAWNARRANWTKPSPEFDEEKFNQHLNSKVFADMVNDSTRKQRAYSFLVRQLREFNQPVPLKYIVPILVTGWQDDGLWPKDMVVKGSD